MYILKYGFCALLSLCIGPGVFFLMLCFSEIFRLLTMHNDAPQAVVIIRVYIALIIIWKNAQFFSSWPSKMLYNCSEMVISTAFVMWFLWIWGGVEWAKRVQGNWKVKSMYIMSIFLQKQNWIALYKLYNRLLSLLICSFCTVVCVKLKASSWYRGKSRLKRPDYWFRICHACVTFNCLPKDYSKAIWSLFSSKQAWHESP